MQTSDGRRNCHGQNDAIVFCMLRTLPPRYRGVLHPATTFRWPQLFSGKPDGQLSPCTGASIRCTSASAAASCAACGQGSWPSPCSTASTLSRTCSSRKRQVQQQRRVQCDSTGLCQNHMALAQPKLHCLPCLVLPPRRMAQPVLDPAKPAHLLPRAEADQVGGNVWVPHTLLDGKCGQADALRCRRRGRGGCRLLQRRRRRVPGGRALQWWHVTSRAECQVVILPGIRGLGRRCGGRRQARARARAHRRHPMLAGWQTGRQPGGQKCPTWWVSRPMLSTLALMMPTPFSCRYGSSLRSTGNTLARWAKVRGVSDGTDCAAGCRSSRQPLCRTAGRLSSAGSRV